MLRTDLPESITLPDGAILYPVIGGCQQQMPFLTVQNSGVDVTRNGWATDLGLTDANIDRMVVAVAKSRRLKYRRIEVLSRNLRGKLDLHRRPYKPTRWIFVERKEDISMATKEVRYSTCPECGQTLEATAEIYLSDVVVDKDGCIVDYRVAFAGPGPEFNTPDGADGGRGSLNLDDPDRYRVYCPDDHPFDLTKAAGKGGTRGK